MRILGIDPGSRITGFGIIEREGNRLRYVESGCIRVGDGDFPGRLKAIFEGISDVVRIYAPEQVAIEQVFMHRNPDSALKLGQARGAAICAVMMLNLPLSEYSPAEIKKATVGRGNAAKEQVQHMVAALLKLPGIPQADAADALAVAMCHSHVGQTLQQIGAARGAKRGRYR
ncbi:MAG: crossover junction endodeoxyribonuclease RuvC [Chromatiales bacterium]|nr:crossover junction endodeoxyribonuclease RuvC [Gammaproteobacteria bacterium]MBW6477162.1 crossover junction endodeoxyribonuclease RuvC [Chromatiales bacterium]